MTLNKLTSMGRKVDNGNHYFMEEYELGNYFVNHYVTIYSGYTSENTECPAYTSEHFDVEAKAHTRALPKIYFNRGSYGKDEKSFAIETTSYGALKADEIKKVIAGYQEAIEAVEILTKEFINKTERG